MSPLREDNKNLLITLNSLCSELEVEALSYAYKHRKRLNENARGLTIEKIGLMAASRLKYELTKLEGYESSSTFQTLADMTLDSQLSYWTSPSSLFQKNLNQALDGTLIDEIR